MLSCRHPSFRRSTMRALGVSVGTAAILLVAAGLLTAADSKEDAVKKELARLQGTWQLVSAETDGKKLPEEQAAKVRVVIKDSKHTVYFGDQTVAKEVAFQ